MPSLRDIRRRIRGIRNTAKITKAMELVAASRLRRAQMRVTAARPYAETMRALVAELGDLAPGGEALHPLLVQREVRTVGVLLVTPERGHDFLVRRGRSLMGTFTGIVDRVTYDDVIPIARVITDGFIDGSIDRAML